MQKDTERAVVEQVVTRKIIPNPQNWWDGYWAGFWTAVAGIVFLIIVITSKMKG